MENLVKNIKIKNRKGLSLSLRLTINSNAKNLFFLTHGLGARNTYPHMLVLEEMFAKNGYNVVNIDVSNSLNESESSNEGPTFSGFINDLEDVICWAKTQDFYTEPFALAGQSLGAGASFFYASKNPKQTSLLILASFAWLSGSDDLKHNKRVPIILEKGYFEQVSKSTGRVLKINRNYIEDFKKYDLTNMVKNITAKTFIIVGEDDSEYHKQNSKNLFDLLECEKQTFMLSGVPHDLANTPENKASFSNCLQTIFDNLKSK